MNSLLRAVESSALFAATSAPYLLLDRGLSIRSANKAYLVATGRSLDEITGRFVFDAFPDNPHDPGANGVRNLAGSLETVLRTSQRSRMWTQRYDVPGRGPGEFVLKYWSPINSPVKDDRGRVAAILHHVEDVTTAYSPAAASPAAGSGDEAPAPISGDHALAADRAGAVAMAHEQQAYARLAAKVEQLQSAFDTRIPIEQAKGILMAERRCGPREAFEILSTAARNSNLKLQDLAAGLVAATARPKA